MRHDALDLVLSIVLMSLGAGAALLFRIRERARDNSLIWLAVFTGLFGVRLLVSTRVFPFLADPLPRELWLYVRAGISYLITIPALRFAEFLFPVRQKLLLWLRWVAICIAVLGLISDQVVHRAESLAVVNHIFPFVFFIGILFESWRKQPTTSDLRALRVPEIILLLAVVINNAAGLLRLNVPIDLEPLAFAFFVAAVGQLAARRAFAKEEKLSSIEKELAIARRIQASILPAVMPSNAHVRIAARYVPMTAVAGDFYDFLIVDDRHLGILVADVSGHGVPAALIASMVKIAFTAQAAHAHDPSAVLAGINQTLAGKLKGQFVTAAYLFLDFDARCLRCATAGHPAVLWLHAETHCVEPLLANGLALGLRSRSSYPVAERPIKPGDRFVLFTDGLFEARNPAGESYDEERIRDFLAAHPDSATEEFADALMTSQAQWARYVTRAQEDDLTLVVVDTLTGSYAPSNLSTLTR